MKMITMPFDIIQKGDSWRIECRKGLWGVSGPELVELIPEALHYYSQYESDGEYDEDPLRVIIEALKNDARG